MLEDDVILSETLKDVKDRVDHIVFGLINDLKDDADVRNDCFKDDILKRLEELENELTDTICQYIKNSSSLDWCEDVARLAQDVGPYEFADNYSPINGYKELAEEIRDSILKGDTKVTDKLKEWAEDEDDKNLRYRASLLLKKSKELAL